MGLYRIADLTVRMSPENQKLLCQSRKYRIKEGEGDGEDIRLREINYEAYGEEYPQMTREDTEYMSTGGQFYRELLTHFGMMLHASAIVYQGKAYLFSADSGTGKSTHTQLWKQYFKNEAYVINDDKPAIRLLDDELAVFGTPWSGKTDINENRRAELGGICFLSRSDSNFIEKLDNKTAIKRIFGQTIRTINEEQMDHLTQLIGEILKRKTIYELHCNISYEAVELAYRTMADSGLSQNTRALIN